MSRTVELTRYGKKSQLFFILVVENKHLVCWHNINNVYMCLLYLGVGGAGVSRCGWVYRGISERTGRLGEKLQSSQDPWTRCRKTAKVCTFATFSCLCFFLFFTKLLLIHKKHIQSTGTHRKKCDCHVLYYMVLLGTT